MTATPDLADLLPSWRLALEAERKAAGTIKNYTLGVTMFLDWCDATGTPPELTRPTVQAFTASLLAGGAEPATAVARQLALKRFSAWLADEDEIPADALVGLRPPKVDRKVVHALTDDELKLLLKACQGKGLKDRRDEAIVRLMLETGMRAGEVIALRTDDVDRDRRLVTIRRGKGGKGRIAPISVQCAAAIDRYIRARRSHRLADTSTLWLGAAGKTFGYTGLDKTLKERAQVAGITGFHLHLMRHTAATRWLRAGGSEGGLMAVAGWSSREMLDRYTGASAGERAADEARNLNLGDL